MTTKAFFSRTACVTLGGLFVALASSTACVDDDPGAVVVSCSSYCTEIAKKCGGDKEQYRSNDECLKACGFLELGTIKDGDVNSVGCRLRKAQNANTKDDCAAAGPFGGGVCGSRCASFCNMDSKHCSTANGVTTPPFKGSSADCNEACVKFAVDASEGESTKQQFDGKDTINCRQFHLILALSDAPGHCPHTDINSATCKPRP
jgi:hypothetical protein